MSGAERFVDLHLVMPKYNHIEDAHQFCDHIEKDIREKIPNLSITIHVEPCNTNCDICKKINQHRLINCNKLDICKTDEIK